MVLSDSTSLVRPSLYLKPCGPAAGPSEFSLTPQTFQKMWGTLLDAFNGRLCKLGVSPSSPADVANLVAKVQIVTMASGPLPATSPLAGFKFFFYGMEKEDLLGDTGAVYLIQMILTVTVIMKKLSCDSILSYPAFN